MKTWLESYHAETDLNRYPIALRTEGGIGYKKHGEIVSAFVGHPVHYEENGQMKPITLDWIPSTGEFEGSWFGWDTIKKCPTYCGYELYTPKAIIWNGIAYPLNFLRLENRMIADIPIGMYEIIYSEGGMKEVITIPEPVEGILEFDTPEQPGWDDYLYKTERKIIGGSQSGNAYQLTKDMSYPLVIDPNFSGETSDGYILSTASVTWATARATSSGAADNVENISHGLFYSGGYNLYRSFFKFNTSGIPDSDVVSQVNLFAMIYGKTISVDFDIYIVKQDWSSQDPLTGAGRETAWDNALTSSKDDNIWQNTSAVSNGNRYSSGDLSTSWVNKTGSTYYSLVASYDYDNVAPAAAHRYLFFYSQNSATSGNRPYLVVTHSTPPASNGSMLAWY